MSTSPVVDDAVGRLTSAMLSTPGRHINAAREQAVRIAPLLSEAEREQLVRSALKRVSGMGVLQAYLDDPDIAEVMVVDGESVWVEDRSGIRRVAAISADDMRTCLERISRLAARRLDLLSPILDCVMPDGSRVCAVIPPIAVAGPALSIRKFPARIRHLSTFADPQCLAIISQLVDESANVVVSGATSSGKTSLISSVSRLFAPDERIVCVEDTAELQFHHPHAVRLQSRPANAEGQGEVTLQHLVRASLRLRPDRLVVGEVRGQEVVDMLLALTSGHRGCWSTVHSPSAADTVDRLRSLVMRDSPHWTSDVIDRTIASGIDAVVHMGRAHGARRCVESIVAVSRCHDGRLRTDPLYIRENSAQ